MPLLKPPRWSWNPSLLEPQAKNLARGLVALIPLWEGTGEPYAYTNGDIVKNSFATTGSFVVSRFGPAWHVDGTANHRVEFGPSTAFGVGFGSTVMWIGTNENTATGKYFWSHTGASTSNFKIGSNSITARVLGGNGTPFEGLPNLLVSGDEHIYVFRIHDPRAATLDYKIAGTKGQASKTWAGDRGVAESNTLHLGVSSVNDNRADARYGMWVHWDRILSDVEVDTLIADPFLLLRPALLETDAALDITPGLVTQLITAFDPVVALDTATQDVTPALLTNLITTFTPTVTTTVDITPGLITQLITASDPTITTTVDVTPALLTQLITASDPVITTTVDMTPALLTQLITTFAPTITTGAANITPALVTQLIVAFNPTITTFIITWIGGETTTSTIGGNMTTTTVEGDTTP